MSKFIRVVLVAVVSILVLSEVYTRFFINESENDTNETVFEPETHIPNTFTGKVTYQNYPFVVSRIKQFSSYEVIGKDESGSYNMYAIKLGTVGKPVIMISASMHGTEWQGTQYTLAMLEMIRDNSFPDVEFRNYLLENYYIVCIPVLNPYGYNNVTNIYDEFNRNARLNSNGAELNHDFKVGNQSEQETKNMIKVVQKYKPFAYLDVHMFQGHYNEPYSAPLIIGHGQAETDDVRDIFADSWSKYTGQDFRKWKPINGSSSGLSRAYVARQSNPYTPFTLSYITEMPRPVNIDGKRVAPLSDEEIYNYGIASIYFFFKTSIDYLENHSRK
ncbi:M14 family zinc carboxypeptidase [Oceanobacillus caeni]